MNVGVVHTMRRLILCGASLALVPGASAAWARSHHHTRHHHTRRHTSTERASPSKKSETSAPKQTGGATSPPAGGGTGKLEFVPGPIPLPTQEKQSGSGNPTSAVGGSGPAGSARQSAAPPATPAAASVVIATPAAPAKSAIDTAVAKLFLGEPVYGAKGEQIGSLSKIMTGPDGQVKSAVITWGGLFGFFQSNRTIDWPDAGPRVRNGNLVLRAMSKSDVRNSGGPQPQASR